jgi:hypothetical protein
MSASRLLANFMARASYPSLSVEKPGTDDLDKWLGMVDVQEFLADTSRGTIAVHFQDRKNFSSVFLASVLIPRRQFNDSSVEELLNWSVLPSEGEWGHTPTARGGYRLTKPFESQQSRILQSAVPLYTQRINTCVEDDRRYYAEINPQVSQVHDLHWVDERSAYCTLDQAGDVYEIVTIDMTGTSRLITIEEKVLMKHLSIGDYILVRLFDVDRSTSDHVIIPSAENQGVQTLISKGEITARLTPVRDENGRVARAYIRGFQIIRPPKSTKDKKALFAVNKEYCTFIAHDFKHERVADVSCNPEELGNYFIESSYPLSTSPAFFKRDVLRRFQDDPDKYSIESDHIYCRSSWSLPFSINEVGQVHAYLKDLGMLPYSEQLYWKSFNEAPKGPISEEAYRRDFLGEWFSSPDPLSALKQQLNTFPPARTSSHSINVWEPPSGLDAKLANKIHYLASTSGKEWENEIVALDRLIVEGLNLKYLRRIANELGIVHENLGSIALLREVLKAKSVAEDIVDSLIVPLQELHGLRSKFSSHRKGSDTEKIAKEIRRKHKDLAAHHRDLIKKLSEAVSVLANLVEKGYFKTTN